MGDPSDNAITPAIRDLVERQVDSFEKFELIRRIWSRRDESLPVATVIGDLRLPGDELVATLTELTALGLVVKEPGDRYRAATRSVHADTILAMLELYARDPLSMLRVLNELALRRLRGLTARKFSDAFILSRKKEDGDG